MKRTLLIVVITLSIVALFSAGPLRHYPNSFLHGDSLTLDSNIGGQYIGGSLQLPSYANSDSTMFLSLDDSGYLVLRPASGGGGGNAGASPKWYESYSFGSGYNLPGKARFVTDTADGVESVQMGFINGGGSGAFMSVDVDNGIRMGQGYTIYTSNSGVWSSNTGTSGPSPSVDINGRTLHTFVDAIVSWNSASPGTILTTGSGIPTTLDSLLARNSILCTHPITTCGTQITIIQRHSGGSLMRSNAVEQLAFDGRAFGVGPVISTLEFASPSLGFLTYEDGNQATGKVLTCMDNNGTMKWQTAGGGGGGSVGPNLVNQTAAPAVAYTYTVPATGMYQVGLWVYLNSLVAPSGNFFVDIIYVDAHSNSRTRAFFPANTGSAYMNGTGDFVFPPFSIKALGGSTIQFVTALNVSGGSVNYDISPRVTPQ